MSHNQVQALHKLCEKYNVEFRAEDYVKSFDLPTGWVEGWIGGSSHGYDYFDPAKNEWLRRSDTTIYIGCSPEGDIHS